MGRGGGVLDFGARGCGSWRWEKAQFVFSSQLCDLARFGYKLNMKVFRKITSFCISSCLREPSLESSYFSSNLVRYTATGNLKNT
jgi:hypothetical protein